MESYRNDISRIKEFLKGEYDEHEDSEKSYDFSNDGDHVANKAELVSQGIGGEEVEVYYPHSQSESVNECLSYCYQLKEGIAKLIGRLDLLEEEISLRQTYLEAKLALCLKCEISDKKKIKYYKPINLFATPYFRDVRKSIPSPNEDSIMKRLSQDVDAYTVPPRPWTSLEHKCLREAVIENSKQKLMEPLIVKRNYYRDKLQNDTVSDKEMNEIKEKVEDLEEALENTRRKTVDELLATDIELDWMRISALMIDGYRTADECEHMWYNYLHPSINKKKWTKDEDDELQKAAVKHHFKDWESIAKELKLSKRTAIQCLERYQSRLNPNMLKSAWTPDDDAELARVVQSCKIGEYIPWNQVCYRVHGRSRLQILNRWTRSIAPNLKKGPWSTEEDAVLIAGVEKYQYHWAKVAVLLPGRSGFACRERYTNVLLPGKIIGSWTKEEDRLLVKLLKKYPEGKWTKIASHLPGRTDNMCLQRASRIRKHHPHLFTNNSSDVDEDIDLEELNTPTHKCQVLNNYRKLIRSTAEESMIKTMMQVKGYKTAEEAEATLAMKKTSRSFLFALSKQLLGENKCTVPLKPQRKVYRPKSRPKFIYRETSSEDEADLLHGDGVGDGEDDDDEWYRSKELSYRNQVKTDEELAVEAELDSFFMLVVSCGYRPIQKGSRCVNESFRDVLERKSLKSILYKALHCFETKSEVESERTTFTDTDFSVSLPSVIENVVFCSTGDEVPVLPPNRMTLEAFKFLLINCKGLASFVSENPCHNTSILSFITSNEQSILLCRSCYQKGKYISQSGVVANVHVLPSRCLGKGDSSESRNGPLLCKKEPVFDSDSSTVSCQECLRLNAQRKDYHLLRRRLFSLFFWPALLTDCRPSEEQRRKLVDDCKIQTPNTSINKKCFKSKRTKRTQSETEDQTSPTAAVSKKAHTRRAKVRHLHAIRKSPRHRFRRSYCNR